MNESHLKSTQQKSQSDILPDSICTKFRYGQKYSVVLEARILITFWKEELVLRWVEEGHLWAGDILFLHLGGGLNGYGPTY